MQSNMRNWLSQFADFVRGAWRELPLETLATATAALSLMGLVHSEPLNSALDAWLARAFFGAVLLTPLFFALTGLCGRRVLGRRTQLATGGLAAAVVLGALLLAIPDTDAIERPAFAWPYGLSLLAATLVPFVAVAVRAGPGNDRLARFTSFLRRFFEQTTTWGLLWLGSMVAVGVVFVALHELFDLDIEEFGADMAIAVTGVFVLSYLYRLMPAQGGSPERDRAPERVPEFWRRLATMIGAPFVSVMLVILVVYEAVVLASGELPRNVLSPLIIGAGFVGFLCTLIIVSLLDEKVGSDTLAPADPHRWARRHSIRLARAFPLVLLALLPMACWALFVRIDQHAFTPFRVARMMALLCLGTLSLLGSLRWLRGRMTPTWEVPVCVIAFALATAFGPISAVRLSLDSQVERLGRLMTEAGIPTRQVATDPVVPATILIDYDLHNQIVDGIQVVGELGGEAALRQVLSGDVAKCANSWSGTRCMERLGVSWRPGGNAGMRYETAEASASFTIAGRELVFVDLDASSMYAVMNLHLKLQRAGTVELYQGERKIAEASLAGMIEVWRVSTTLPPELLALTRPDGAAFGHLAVHRLTVYETENGPEVMRLSGAWLPPATATPAPATDAPAPATATPAPATDAVP
jgi:hypothetical protein